MRSAGSRATSVEQLLARGVDPVRILDDHQHRLDPRERFDLAEQHLERLFLLLLRREPERRVPRLSAATAARRTAAPTRRVGCGCRPACVPACRASAPACPRARSRPRARCARSSGTGRPLDVETASTGNAGWCAVRRRFVSRSTSVSRDLPMPASPPISTTRPAPLRATSQSRSSSATSSVRPTSALSGAPPWAASKRPAARRTPSTRQLATARFLERQRAEIGQFEGITHETPGRVRDQDFVGSGRLLWSRAARFGVSPTASPASPPAAPGAPPTTT